MPKHEISNVRTRGTGAIEKLIFYKTEVSEHQEIRVRAEFEGDPEPEQIKQISEVVKKAAEEIGKNCGRSGETLLRENHFKVRMCCAKSCVSTHALIADARRRSNSSFDKSETFENLMSLFSNALAIALLKVS